MKRFRRGLVFDPHRLVCHSTLGSRVIKKKKKKKKKKTSAPPLAPAALAPSMAHPAIGFTVKVPWVMAVNPALASNTLAD